MKTWIALLVTVLAGCSNRNQTEPDGPDLSELAANCSDQIAFYQPLLGAIPNAEVAKSVAYQYLHVAYSEDSLRPLSARLDSGIWQVDGHFSYLPWAKGDGATIYICQRNGRILKIEHGE